MFDPNDPPTPVLAERVQDWFYHGTKPHLLDSIAHAHALTPSGFRGQQFVSFSDKIEKASKFGKVILVFRKRSIKDRLMQVKYTSEWAGKYPKHARYIADQSHGYDEKIFIDRDLESEWITFDEGKPMPFWEGELVAALVNKLSDIKHVRRALKSYLPPHYVVSMQLGIRLIKSGASIGALATIPSRHEILKMKPDPRIAQLTGYATAECMVSVVEDKTRPVGDCYEAAFNWVYQHCLSPAADRVGDKNIRLVQGEVMGSEGSPIAGLKYGHAWVEDGGMVIDRSNGRNLRMPRELYYALGRVGTNVYRYTPAQVRKKASKHRHYGPWDLKTESGL